MLRVQRLLLAERGHSAARIAIFPAAKTHKFSHQAEAAPKRTFTHEIELVTLGLLDCRSTPFPFLRGPPFAPLFKPDTIVPSMERAGIESRIVDSDVGRGDNDDVLVYVLKEYGLVRAMHGQPQIVMMSVWDPGWTAIFLSKRL